MTDARALRAPGLATSDITTLPLRACLDESEEFTRAREAPPVPTTSIFSRSDGIVAWPCCVQEAGPMAESIEVAASHIGMGLNPAAWYVVADRLAQREGQWRAFHREGWRQWLYRAPHRAGDRG